MRALRVGCRRRHQTVLVLLGSLLLAPAFGKDETPRADAQSAVIFGTESPRHVGPPADVTILRVNNEETNLGLSWSKRRFWRAPPGEVYIKILCTLVDKTGFGHQGQSQLKLLTARLEAGHYYQFTCEKFAPAYLDRGTDAAAISELTAH